MEQIDEDIDVKTNMNSNLKQNKRYIDHSKQQQYIFWEKVKNNWINLYQTNRLKLAQLYTIRMNKLLQQRDVILEELYQIATDAINEIEKNQSLLLEKNFQNSRKINNTNMIANWQIAQLHLQTNRLHNNDRFSYNNNNNNNNRGGNNNSNCTQRPKSQMHNFNIANISKMSRKPKIVVAKKQANMDRMTRKRNSDTMTNKNITGMRKMNSNKLNSPNFNSNKINKIDKLNKLNKLNNVNNVNMNRRQEIRIRNSKQIVKNEMKQNEINDVKENERKDKSNRIGIAAVQTTRNPLPLGKFVESRAAVSTSVVGSCGSNSPISIRRPINIANNNTIPNVITNRMTNIIPINTTTIVANSNSMTTNIPKVKNKRKTNHGNSINNVNSINNINRMKTMKGIQGIQGIQNIPSIAIDKNMDTAMKNNDNMTKVMNNDSFGKKNVWHDNDVSIDGIKLNEKYYQQHHFVSKRCHECDKSFRSEELFQQHLNDHEVHNNREPGPEPPMFNQNPTSSLCIIPQNSSHTGTTTTTS